MLNVYGMLSDISVSRQVSIMGGFCLTLCDQSVCVTGA